MNDNFFRKMLFDCIQLRFQLLFFRLRVIQHRLCVRKLKFKFIMLRFQLRMNLLLKGKPFLERRYRWEDLDDLPKSITP